jgi:hypothetical protein
MKLLPAVVLLPSHCQATWRWRSWLLAVCCPLSHWGKPRPGGMYPTGPVTRTFLGVEVRGFEPLGFLRARENRGIWPTCATTDRAADLGRRLAVVDPCCPWRSHRVWPQCGPRPARTTCPPGCTFRPVASLVELAAGPGFSGQEGFWLLASCQVGARSGQGRVGSIAHIRLRASHRPRR